MVSTIGNPWVQQQELDPGDPATGPLFHSGGAETGDQRTNEQRFLQLLWFLLYICQTKTGSWGYSPFCSPSSFCWIGFSCAWLLSVVTTGCCNRCLITSCRPFSLTIVCLLCRRKHYLRCRACWLHREVVASRVKSFLRLFKESGVHASVMVDFNFYFKEWRK